MDTNLTKYKDDLKKLIIKGDELSFSLILHKKKEKDLDCIIDKNQEKFLLMFEDDYQNWYTESLELIKQLLPNRLNDFIDFYKNVTRNPNEIDVSTYTISDYLIGLVIVREDTFIAGEAKDIANRFDQQLNILKSVQNRFESSLFDIRQLLNADIFDNELDSATELLVQGFTRAAGAICGVVLEKHLKEVLINHSIDIADKFKNKKPCINDLNTLLKSEGIIDIPTWRKVQWLGDIRNQCDHAGTEPKPEDVKDLIEGIKKITKTIF